MLDCFTFVETMKFGMMKEVALCKGGFEIVFFPLGPRDTGDYNVSSFDD